jgi:bis(5'-nucleosyl)-tetraphosphatase (symmetrical)
MRWLVGDVQGCLRELELLLETIRFDASRDELWLLGDLVNKGPDSLGVLRLWRDLGGHGVLGNHDAHALLAYSGTRPKKLPTLEALFGAPDAGELLERLRALPILAHLPSEGDGPDAWVVHGGLHPGWIDLPVAATQLNAAPHDDAWLRSDPTGFAISVRCCTRDGRRCDFTGAPSGCPPPFRPWDELYRGETLVVHGHWAVRGHYRGPRTMGLDSGCVYGGPLTAWCQEEDRIVQVCGPGSV